MPTHTLTLKKAQMALIVEALDSHLLALSSRNIMDYFFPTDMRELRQDCRKLRAELDALLQKEPQGV